MTALAILAALVAGIVGPVLLCRSLYRIAYDRGVEHGVTLTLPYVDGEGAE